MQNKPFLLPLITFIAGVLLTDGWHRYSDPKRTLVETSPIPASASIVPEAADRYVEDRAPVTPGGSYTLSTANVDEAITTALAQKDKRARFITLQGLFSSWAEDDAKAAMLRLRQIDDAQLQMTIGQAILPKLAEQSPDDALAMLQTIEEPANRRMATNMILGSIAEKDPWRAINYYEALPETPDKFALVGSLANGIAKQDPNAALQWADQLPEQAKRTAYAATAQIWAQDDLTAAADFTVNLSGEERAQWISTIARTQSRSAPEATISWLQQFEGEKAHASAQNIALTTWARQDPQGALQYLGQQAKPESYNAALVTAVSQWSQKDIDSAKLWVVAQPEGYIRQRGAASIAAKLAHKDIDAAQIWLGNLGIGRTRDVATQSLVNRMSDAPAQAATLINSIGDDQLRLATLRSSYARWRHARPEAAEQLLDQAARNADEASALRGAVGNGIR